jgi:hypothetical protein
MATRVTGDYEDFKKALDKINPDPTTHYKKKSTEDDIQEVKELTLEEQAIQTLITGCEMACQKGVFTLDEARSLMNAIDFLNNSE